MCRNEEKNTLKKSRTDWACLEAMRDEDLDLSDIPKVTPEMFAKGVIRVGLKPVTRKSQVTLRLDQDVLTWFKAQGRGYQIHSRFVFPKSHFTFHG